MRDRVVRLGFRLVLLVLLGVSAAGLVVLLALGRSPAQAFTYAALVGMLALASGWAGGSLFISRSIKVLVAATRRIVAGDFTARVDFADSSSEIRRLGELFNEVARALERHVTSAQGQADALADQAAALREKACLLDLAHDAVLVRGMDGIITYWNRAAEELYGWPASEAVGSQARALLRYESSTFTMDQIEQALFSDGRWEGEMTHVAREGIPIWVSSRWTLERDAQGAPLRILELNSNIGDRKRADDFVCAVTADLERRVLERTAELAQANQRLQGEIDERARTVEELGKVIEVAKAATQAKSTFLANMSHEIRTPLNGVTGMIGLLLNTPLSAQQLKYATIARSAADTLLALISDILDFSKLEASGVELEAAPFAPREVVETLLETFAPRAAAKGLELTCHFQSELPALVCGDAHRLRQVLNNLLSNAIKFTSKGHVAVRATVEREINSHIMIGFSVTDTGMGISPEGRERLFQPFSQADSSISRSFGGTGLGLAISRGLVDLMGGQIEVESEPGLGSTFRFTLILEKAGVGNSSFSWRAVADEVRRLRALVVTSHETTRAIMREHLANWTAAMGTAPDGAAALEALREAAEAGEPYRLVIMDLHLERAESLRLARMIKAGEFRDVILLAVISLDDSVDPGRWKALGFAGTVAKPLLPSRLLDAITDAVAPGSEVPRTVAADGAARLVKASGIRVLLAEDNEVNQLVAMETLAAAGFSCDIVSTGKQALEAVFSKNYDLVLMDCQMPEMDGIEATRLIRKREATAPGSEGAPARRTPILAVTANATKADREQALAAGMDGYLTKPIEPRRLIEAMWSLFPERVDDERPAGVRQPAAAQEQSPVTPTANGPGSSPPPMDLDALLVRCLNNVELVRRLLEKFEELTMRDVEAIGHSISAGDLEQAARASHGLKGTAASMSAGMVRGIAAEIEGLLRSANADGAAGRLASLREEVQRCIECIPRLLERLPDRQPGTCAAPAKKRADGAPLSVSPASAEGGQRA